MANPRHQLGARAEDATASWLAAAGWQILARRYRSANGELDLVGRDPGGTLVAIEVKLRRTGRAGTALEAVDRRRLGRLRAALAGYASASGVRWTSLRVDLVAVEPAGGAWRLQHHRGIDAW